MAAFNLLACPRQSASTMYGECYIKERRLISWPIAIMIYKRQRIQKWSPLMHEIEREVGLRIHHVRLTVTWSFKRFFDGKEPRDVKGMY